MHPCIDESDDGLKLLFPRLPAHVRGSREASDSYTVSPPTNPLLLARPAGVRAPPTLQAARRVNRLPSQLLTLSNPSLHFSNHPSRGERLAALSFDVETSF